MQLDVKHGRIQDEPADLIVVNLLEGVMHVSGQLQEGIEPFETKFRFEFHDEVDGRTRLEIRQWLPEHVTGPSEGGWLEAFAKLDAMLNGARAGSAPVVEV